MENTPFWVPVAPNPLTNGPEMGGLKMRDWKKFGQKRTIVGKCWTGKWRTNNPRMLEGENAGMENAGKIWGTVRRWKMQDRKMEDHGSDSNLKL